MSLSELAEKIWYQGHPLAYLLLPLSWCYRLVVSIRQQLYKAGLLPVTQLDIPIIVIGNITVGGTGKSPLTVWLVDYLKQKGRKPGIVSRGYGGKLNKNIQQVRTDSNPELVGDEPVMIARKTRCPVAIGKNRSQAAKELIEYESVDVIICDDGLQHYALNRDLEIAVIDGLRRHGNSLCLPAGPLREPISRLQTVDMIIANARSKRGEYLMDYEYGDLISISNPGMTKKISDFANQHVHAVCGIGSPDKFYSYLIRHDLVLNRHQFPDHYYYQSMDLSFEDDYPIVMTEKDAVKCESIANENMWYLPITAVLPESFTHRLDKYMKEIGIG